MLRYKVSLSTNISAGSIVGLNAHGWNVPPAAPIPAVPTVDYPLPNFWPPGSGLGQNKLTRRVTHCRAAIVQDGHDVGALIPHLALPPQTFNVLTPIHTLFSKRKTIFFESSVRFESRFVASCNAIAMPPTPMMSCNDPISMPIATSADFQNTVEFGMSPWSYGVSYLAMAATVVVDSAFKGMWPKKLPAKDGPASAPPSGLELLGAQLGQKLAGGREPTEILAKVGLEGAIGLGKLGLTSGDRTVSISVPGSPFIRTSASEQAGKRGFETSLHGLSDEGDNAWAETRRRMGLDKPWGADLG